MHTNNNNNNNNNSNCNCNNDLSKNIIKKQIIILPSQKKKQNTFKAILKIAQMQVSDETRDAEK